MLISRLTLHTRIYRRIKNGTITKDFEYIRLDIEQLQSAETDEMKRISS